MKVLIIAATHGDELLGVKVHERLLATHSPLLEHVDTLIGNPRAYAARTRYIDIDLNRSHGGENTGYESTRAKEIQEYIRRTQPDIVLDMHTTTVDQPSCLIVSSLDEEMKRRYMRSSSISRVLQVRPMGDILQLGDDILGYEVSRANMLQEVDTVIADITRFIAGEMYESKKSLYVMQGKLYKREVSAAKEATLRNFVPHELGFVPVLVGENSYKTQTDYLGFKTALPEEIML